MRRDTGGDGRDDVATWTADETPASAVETASSDDGGERSGRTRRSPWRDAAILALVSVSPLAQLVGAGGFDAAAFAVAAVVVAAVASTALALAPLAGLDDWLRRAVILTGLAVGAVGVAWVVLVLEPPAVRYASASLGVLAGAAVANGLDRRVGLAPALS